VRYTLQMTTSSPVQSTSEVLGLILNSQFISAETHKPIEVTEARMQDAIDPIQSFLILANMQVKPF